MPEHFLTIATIIGSLFVYAGQTGSNGGSTEGDAKHGESVFSTVCSNCHALEKNKKGPRLGDVVGRQSATVPKFSYSSALKKANLTWNEENLEKWLTDPESLVPDNDMGFALQDAQDRKDVIAYLKSLTNKPQ
jgi:cytochrome c